jgi:signal transduction histidine kinase
MAAYAHLSYYYEKAGNYKSALQYQILYTNIMDSVYIEENKQQIAEMMVRYETESKERENELLRQQSEIQALQISRQRNIRNSFVILALVLLLLAVTLYSRYRIKRRTSILLEEKNRQLALLNASRDKFYRIIAHDLKNPFSTLMQVSEKLQDQFHNLDNEQKLRIISLIKQSTVYTHELLANLLQWSVLQTGEMKLEPGVTDLSVITHEAMDLLGLHADKKEIRLISEIPEGTEVYADRNMVATVMRNLISNAIKYSDRPGQVRVFCEVQDGIIQVMIKDEGIGISPDDIEKLFRIDVNTSTIGRSKEKGTGLGLILSKEFIEKNGGRIWVESEPSRGSLFIFTLPKPELR